MIKSKVFVKSLRKGNVLKTVREHYLRDDILCGSTSCDNCPGENTCLQSNPESYSDLCRSPHYIIPDTNVLLHQIDVLLEPAFKNVILLQTVLDEVRKRQSPSYKRLKEVLSNADRHFYTFHNEHHRNTFIERNPGESANDRNDRAIRIAVKWYQNHINDLGEKCDIKIILLTNDKANLEEAEKDGLNAYTFSEYVNSLKEFPSLVDKLAKFAPQTEHPGTDMLKQKKGCIYSAHLPISQIQTGLKANKLHQGKYQASRENYLEGYVFISGDDDNSDAQSIFIQGWKNINRAIQNDIVAIEILPEEKWSCPSRLVLEDKNDNVEDEEAVIDAEEKIIKKKKRSSKIPTGIVVGIIKRNWKHYCGILQQPSIKESSHFLFVPADRRIPKIKIETRQGANLLSKKVLIAIDNWPRTSRYPLGHLVECVGDIGDKNTENKVLLLEHDIPHHFFSQAVLECLPKLPWIITEEDVRVRKDLRHITICSVDPPGCTDIDDALHCRHLENGNLEVGVHIADVTHFIRPGTAIDKEAEMRGTTVYLVDQRIDMVPDLLSSNLCSLRGNEERFAFTVIWEMTPDAEILRTDFFKSIIRSRAALTYEEAQMRIDDKSMSDNITVSLRLLNSLAKIMKKKRISNGALSLASTEVRFAMDTETHDPIDVEKKVLRETNSMVEEFMLLANISVAKFIHKEFPDCAILRRHPVPPVSNFEPLIKAGLSRGFKIIVDKGKDLADSLDAAEDPSNPMFNVMLRMVATRCMTQALYFSSGTLPESDFLHYGLAVPIYTHFTSPIRRYADVLVHRLLAVAIGADVTYPDLVKKQKAQEICNNLNYRHKQAQYCGRASVNLYTHIFFKDKVVEEEGYIFFIRENALQILLIKYGLECTLYLCSVNKENDTVKFHYDDEGPTQTAEGVTLRQFDPVIVQLHINSDNVQHQKVVLKLVKPKILGFSVPSLCEEPATKKQKVETTCN